MIDQHTDGLSASCRCGKVKITTMGSPIAAPVCYCIDCQNGARLLDSLPGACRIADDDGGTACLLYAKDRLKCSSGAALLRSYKLNADAATSRIVASCCNTPMLMAFDDRRHWVAAYRARFRGNLPAIQMRICTKSKAPGTPIPVDAPSYPGYPVTLITKLMAAWIPMLFRPSSAKWSVAAGELP